jgi:hypothetical protein
LLASCARLLWRLADMSPPAPCRERFRRLHPHEEAARQRLAAQPLRRPEAERRRRPTQQLWIPDPVHRNHLLNPYRQRPVFLLRGNLQLVRAEGRRLGSLAVPSQCPYQLHRLPFALLICRNAAGCGCLPNRDALLRAIPTTNAPLPANMAPAALASSFCGFTAAQFYSSTTGKCAVPAGGSNKCPAAKPAIENKCPAPQNLAASRCGALGLQAQSTALARIVAKSLAARPACAVACACAVRQMLPTYRSASYLCITTSNVQHCCPSPCQCLTRTKLCPCAPPPSLTLQASKRCRPDPQQLPARQGLHKLHPHCHQRPRGPRLCHG